MAVTAISRDSGLNVNIVRVSSSNTLAQVAAADYILNQAANIAALNNGEFEWLVGDMVLVAARTISPTSHSNSPLLRAAIFAA